MRPTNSVIYGTLRYTLQAICCCASYILLSRLGLGINFIQWVALRSYNDTQFVAVALFVVTPALKIDLGKYILETSKTHKYNIQVLVGKTNYKKTH